MVLSSSRVDVYMDLIRSPKQDQKKNLRKASIYSKYKTFPLKDYPCCVIWIILNQALIIQTNWFIRLAVLVIESLVFSNPKVHT